MPSDTARSLSTCAEQTHGEAGVSMQPIVAHAKCRPREHGGGRGENAQTLPCHDAPMTPPAPASPSLCTLAFAAPRTRPRRAAACPTTRSRRSRNSSSPQPHLADAWPQRWPRRSRAIRCRELENATHADLDADKFPDARPRRSCPCARAGAAGRGRRELEDGAAALRRRRARRVHRLRDLREVFRDRGDPPDLRVLRSPTGRKLTDLSPTILAESRQPQARQRDEAQALRREGTGRDRRVLELADRPEDTRRPSRSARTCTRCPGAPSPRCRPWRATWRTRPRRPRRCSPGCSSSFCTRQFNSSATNSVFSSGHAISCTQPNCFSARPGPPMVPSTLPSRLIL